MVAGPTCPVPGITHHSEASLYVLLVAMAEGENVSPESGKPFSVFCLASYLLTS